MARRIMAAALAGLAIATVSADRLPGASTTTTTAPAPSTTSPLDALIRSDRPNPLQRYPRRPGAKWQDIEAAVDQTVQLGFMRVAVKDWSRVPHSALPARARPGGLAGYRAVAMVDGYAPVRTETDGDLLRVRVAHTKFGGPAKPRCVATLAGDGTRLVPYDTRESPRTNPTTTTKPKGELGATTTIFLPIGEYRGRVYLTCTHRLLGEDNAVWALDA